MSQSQKEKLGQDFRVLGFKGKPEQELLGRGDL